MIHTTPYCGSLERACIKLKVPVLSITDNQVNHTYTVMTVGNALMEVRDQTSFVRVEPFVLLTQMFPH